MKRDSLIAHCLARAAIWQGYDVGKSISWAALRAAPKATRVAGFIVLWALLKHERPDEPVTTEALVERWDLPARSVGRYRAEFRELFPEHETPEPIAALLVDELDARELSRSGPLAHVTL